MVTGAVAEPCLLAGKAGSGVVAVRAAYRAGSTASTVTNCPPGPLQLVDQTTAGCRIPGTAETLATAAAVTWS